MNYVLKMMNFVLKMMDFAQKPAAQGKQSLQLGGCDLKYDGFLLINDDLY